MSTWADDELRELRERVDLALRATAVAVAESRKVAASTRALVASAKKSPVVEAVRLRTTTAVAPESRDAAIPDAA